MSEVKSLEDDDQLQIELASAGDRLVVVFYTATWCAPCKKMKPVFESLSKKYEDVVFISLDVDVCQETAISQGVTAMPTFAFHKHSEKVDVMQGADPILLEEKINLLIKKSEVEVAGHIDLIPFVLKNECECLNESDSHPLTNVFDENEEYLQSDFDEQLMISITFQQPVKLHSIKIRSPEENGPKNVKIFINQPNTLDFDSGESNTPIQELELTPDQLDFTPIGLQYVRFQHVNNIQFFIKSNQSGTETTVIQQLGFIGTLLSSTNMGDFKRVSGKRGEVC